MLIQKNIETLIFLSELEIESDEELNMLSNSDWKLSSLAFVSKCLRVQYSEDIVENVLQMILKKDISAKEIAQITYS